MKNAKLRTKIMVLAIIPIFVVGILLAVVSFGQLYKTILAETENSLEAAAEAVSAAYNQNSGDYFQNDNGDVWKGGYNISMSESLIDNISENTGMAVTFFYGDRRIVTSLKDQEGRRILGSPAGELIRKKVLEQGNSYFSSQVSVEGVWYLGYYIPVYQNNSEEEIVGMIFVGTPKEEVTGKISKVCMMIGLILLAALVCTIIVVTLVSNRISIAIRSGISTLTDIADGNLTMDIDGDYMEHTDEVGELLQSTCRLKDSLVAIVSGLAGNTRELGESSVHINELLEGTSQEIATMEQAIRDIAEGIRYQSQAAEEASQGIDTIDRMIRDTTREAKELGISAESMHQAGQQASEHLESLNAVNREVLQAVGQIQKDTNMTNEAADHIREAVAVIMEIAEETNLLALNASIEAARAGESGRGFAVVASQIQKLAEQSGASSDRINKIVERLSSSSDQSVRTMNHVQEVINKQSEDIVQTEQIFDSVETGIDSSMKGIERIWNSVNHLEEAKASIVNLIQTLTRATRESEENTTTTLESAHVVKEAVGDMLTASDGLKEMAEDLSGSVRTFKI
ncbi:MAG: methyl-accepting chemotaxis protein [Lachnospiraceae bacterium]|nr:methyl-accepting chemotaxis protein [Lachnospiraceae bacterium]